MTFKSVALVIRETAAQLRVNGAVVLNMPYDNGHSLQGATLKAMRLLGEKHAERLGVRFVETYSF